MSSTSSNISELKSISPINDNSSSSSSSDNSKTSKLKPPVPLKRKNKEKTKEDILLRGNNSNTNISSKSRSIVSSNSNNNNSNKSDNNINCNGVKRQKIEHHPNNSNENLATTLPIKIITSKPPLPPPKPAPTSSTENKLQKQDGGSNLTKLVKPVKMKKKLEESSNCALVQKLSVLADKLRLENGELLKALASERSAVRTLRAQNEAESRRARLESKKLQDTITAQNKLSIKKEATTHHGTETPEFIKLNQELLLLKESCKSLEEKLQISSEVERKLSTDILEMKDMYELRLTQANNTASIEIDKLTIPFVGVIPGKISIGGHLRITGQMAVGGKYISIWLQKGSVPERNNCCLHLSIRPDENCIIRNHLDNQKWGEDERHGGCPIKRGDYYDILISATKSFFQISINGVHFCTLKYRLPVFENSDYIIVTGDTTVTYIGHESKPVLPPHMLATPHMLKP